MVVMIFPNDPTECCDTDGDGVGDNSDNCPENPDLNCLFGCTNPESINYNENATNDDGSCIDLNFGCTDPFACNYDSEAEIDTNGIFCTYPDLYYDCNGNCINDTDGDNICDELEILGCTDPEAINYNESATDSDNSQCDYVGCTDPLADNYNPNAVNWMGLGELLCVV